MVEMREGGGTVDTRDLKSLEPGAREGSNPSPPTFDRTPVPDVERAFLDECGNIEFDVRLRSKHPMRDGRDDIARLVITYDEHRHMLLVRSTAGSLRVEPHISNVLGIYIEERL